jgi:hypothetical protein
LYRDLSEAAIPTPSETFRDFHSAMLHSNPETTA